MTGFTLPTFDNNLSIHFKRSEITKIEQIYANSFEECLMVNGSAAAASFHPIKINQRISLSSLAESRTTSWKHCFIQNGMRSREEEEKVIIYWIKIQANVLDPIDRSYFEIQRKSKKNVQSERRTYLNKVQSLNES